MLGFLPGKKGDRGFQRRKRESTVLTEECPGGTLKPQTVDYCVLDCAKPFGNVILTPLSCILQVRKPEL